MKWKTTIWSTGFLFLLFCAEGQVKLPTLIRDSMVLQRNDTIRIYGWASPGEKIFVSFHQKKYSAQTSKDGSWKVAIPPMKAGGPYTMEIKGKNLVRLKDILIGDVFLCAGQSNMVHQLRLHRFRYASEISNANYPMIRHFTVPNTALLNGPASDLPSGNWKSANPKDVMEFSAVAYFFALDLYEKYTIPIGLINASVGGTPIEAWMSEEAIKKFPNSLSVLEKNKDTFHVNQLFRNAAARNALLPPIQDEGMNGNVKWYDAKDVSSGWQQMMVPGYWEDQGLKNLDGIIWFKKTIELPKDFVSLPTLLSLGRIVDADEVYVNGKAVGRTTYQYPQRRYDLPASLLREGKNIITVRITNYNGKGGWVPDKPYFIANEKDTIMLSGSWQYKIGDVFETSMQWQGGLNTANQPAALFNGMVAPLTRYPIKAALWYQGESNTQQAEKYGSLLKALIYDWRTRWNKELPFLFAQLPNFNEKEFGAVESGWARLRDEQRKTLEVPKTAMAITIDLGEWNDIHPGNKKDVGLRLAAAAR
ncbi:MAG: sialate O-acetylesterase, partial [Flavisolibacter sp.]